MVYMAMNEAISHSQKLHVADPILIKLSEWSTSTRLVPEFGMAQIRRAEDVVNRPRSCQIHAGPAVRWWGLDV